MLNTIFDTLTSCNLKPYFVGQHRGECKKPYVVIKDGGTSAISGVSLNQNTIDIILFFPFGRFSDFSSYMDNVTTALGTITQLKDARHRTAMIVDEEKKAYTTTLRYFIYQAYHK